MFEVCVFHRLKGCFCELIKYNRKASLRKIPGVPYKTQSSEGAVGGVRWVRWGAVGCGKNICTIKYCFIIYL